MQTDIRKTILFTIHQKYKILRDKSDQKMSKTCTLKIKNIPESLTRLGALSSIIQKRE